MSLQNKDQKIFASSSAGIGTRNFDGTTNVHCTSCRQLICKINAPVTTALCELCRRVENGEPMSNDIIITYEMGKGQYQDISMLAVQEEQKQQPEDKRTLRSMGAGVLKALGIIPDEEPVSEPSVVIARDKKLRPLFEDEKID